MALTEEHSYNVIQFIELPYENINKYIIIPHSWIRIFLQSEGTVIVAYPIEDEKKTYKRVQNNKNFEKEWKRYTAVVKYEACTFDEARCWISVATLGFFNMYNNGIEIEMDHERRLNGAQNLNAALNNDLEDDVTSPILINVKENCNDYSADTGNYVPEIKTDGADTRLAHIDESETVESVVPINNDTNKHAATSLNNCTDSFVNPARNNDAIEHILLKRGNTASDSVAPIYNTDINNRVAVNNCIDDCVPSAHNNVSLKRNDNTNARDPSRHNANNCTDNQAAPNHDALYDNGAVDLESLINNNETNGYVSPIKDGSENNNITPISNEESLDQNVPPQNMSNAVTASTTNNLIETDRPSSVIMFNRSKSSATQQKTCATTFFDCQPPTAYTKPRMTVMPLMNKHNELTASNSVIECIRIQELTNNDKKIDRERLINHANKQTNPILQDDCHQQLSLERTSSVNSACQQAYPQGSSSANLSLNPLENLNLVQEHISPVSINYWTQDHNSPLFVSPSAYINSFQNNMAFGNENLRRAHHNYNKQPVTLHKNSSCAESIRPNIAHYTVSQINHIDQTDYSRNATATASTQHLTECPTHSGSNSGLQTTSPNKKFTLAKAKFSLTSVQQSELSRPDYNNLLVTQHESHSSIESVSVQVDYRINQKNHIDEKVYSSKVKHAALPEYSSHSNFNYGQQTCNTVHQTITQEPSPTNPLYHKKSRKNSPEQAQRNSSNYTVSMQPPQIIITNSTDEVLTSPNIPKNQSSSVKKSFNAAPRHSVPTAFQRLVSHNPLATQIPVRKPMVRNSVYFQNGFQHNMVVQPSVLRNPGHPNANMQTSQFIRPLNSKSLTHNTPTFFTNAPHTQGMHTAILTTANNVYQGPRFEGHVNTGASDVQNITYHVIPFSDNTSIDKSNGVQETNGLFLRQPTNIASYNQRTSVRSTSMSLPLGEQQYPSANQRNPGQFNEQHIVPIYENNRTHMQNINTSRIAAVNTRSFIPPPCQQHLQYSQNIESLASNHSIQRNQYHCPNKCCNPNAVMATTVQNLPHQNQNLNSQFSAENATTQLFEYLEENQHATIQPNSSNILQYKQHNCTEHNGCGTNHTKNIPNSKEKYESLINQAEAYIMKEPISPSDSSDEGMLTIIEQSNNAKDCVPEGSNNRKYYEKSDLIPSICLDFADEEISIKEITFDKTNDAKNKVQRIALKHDKNYLPDNCTQSSIKTHLKKIKSMSSKTGDIDVWKKLKERINAYIDCKINEYSSEVKLFRKNTKENNRVQNLCLDDEQPIGDDSEDDSDEPPQKKPLYRKWQRQVLPPEYDPNDTKWTLKYREASPELTELIYESNIFVSTIALATCKRIAKNYKTLARMLLTEVFKKTALEVCSLTGVRAREYIGPESKVKVGLNPKAVETILMYVKTYGHSQGWGLFDFKSVKCTLRGKLDLYRRHQAASTLQRS